MLRAKEEAAAEILKQKTLTQETTFLVLTITISKPDVVTML